MAIMHVRFECPECAFVTTDGVEAEEHADALRHCVDVSGEILPRPGRHPTAESRTAAEGSAMMGAGLLTYPPSCKTPIA